MAGSADFTISGKVTYILDKGLFSGRDYGNIRIRIDMPGQYIGRTLVKEHGVWLSLRYNANDMLKARFVQFMQNLVKGKYILVRGGIKPRAASADGKYPASYFLDASWTKAAISDVKLECVNRVIFDGEVVQIQGQQLFVKYSYNTRGKTQEWKERDFCIMSAGQVNKPPRAPIYIEGRVFAVDPNTGKEMVWMFADMVV